MVSSVRLKEKYSFTIHDSLQSFDFTVYLLPKWVYITILCGPVLRLPELDAHARAPLLLRREVSRPADGISVLHAHAAHDELRVRRECVEQQRLSACASELVEEYRGDAWVAKGGGVGDLVRRLSG